jgi:hypothetical protein
MVSADCRCPPSSQSSHFLITTARGTRDGFVACGYEDGRRGKIVRASEFEVFRCSDERRLLEFGAVVTADLESRGDDLRVVRVENWPFGRKWKWVYVSLAELLLSSTGDSAGWQPRLGRPFITSGEVRAFLHEYRTAVRKQGHGYTPDEEVVARLFVAMASGDREARQLFRSMRTEVNLDGATAEIYNMAVKEYELGTCRPIDACRAAMPLGHVAPLSAY